MSVHRGAEEHKYALKICCFLFAPKLRAIRFGVRRLFKTTGAAVGRKQIPCLTVTHCLQKIVRIDYMKGAEVFFSAYI